MPNEPLPRHQPPITRLVRTQAETAELLGVTRASVLAMLKRGQLTGVHIGRLHRVSQASIDALVAGKERGNAA